MPDLEQATRARDLTPGFVESYRVLADKLLRKDILLDDLKFEVHPFLQQCLDYHIYRTRSYVVDLVWTDPTDRPRRPLHAGVYARALDHLTAQLKRRFAQVYKEGVGVWEP